LVMASRLGRLQAGKLADVLVIDGKTDENLDDLAKVDLVIRDGYKVVEGGRVTIPRHQAQTMKVTAPYVQSKMLIFNSIDGMGGEVTRAEGERGRRRSGDPVAAEQDSCEVAEFHSE